MNSGKARFLKEFGFTQTESVDPVIGQFGQKHDPRHPGKAGSGTGGKLSQFIELCAGR